MHMGMTVKDLYADGTSLPHKIREIPVRWNAVLLCA